MNAINKITILLVFMLLAMRSAAQSPTQTIRGSVIDLDTRQPLPGANVVVIDSSRFLGAATDMDGHFRIENVPVGRIRLKVSYIGYNTALLDHLVLTSAKELVVEVKLREKVITGKEVEIVAKREKTETLNKMTIASARQISMEETNRYAGTLNDVARMASSYAGIQSTDDSRNDIVVRGNSPLGVVYRLEGVDIPNPNHFGAQGTTGGPISILNNNVLGNSDFLTGAFPAEYGNALAGIFDLRFRNGNNERHEFLAQIGMNGAEMMAEGPLNKKHRSSYLVDYRYSTLDLFKMLGISFGTLSVPKYQDAAFKLNFPGKHGTTVLFGMGGYSSIALLGSDIDTTNNNNIYNRPAEDIIFSADVGVLGLSSTRLLGKNMYLKVVVSGNTMGNHIDEDSLSNGTLEPIPYYRNRSRNSGMAANLFLNRKLTAKHTLRAGLMINLLHYSIIDSSYIALLNSFITLTDYNGEGWQLRPYTEWMFRPTNDISINTGVMYHHFLWNNTWSIEPRFAIRWQPKGRSSYSFAYGLHSQIQPQQIYFTQLTLTDGSITRPNKDLDMSKAHHFVLGYDHRLSEYLHIKVSLYYQYLFNIPVNIHPDHFSMLNNGADYGVSSFPDTLENSGTGTNYGLEWTLERFLNDGFYYLLTASAFNSLYKGKDGIERNTAFNGRYAGNLLMGKEFLLKSDSTKTQRHILDLNIRLVYMGGKPYTPVDLPLSQRAGYAIYRWDRINEERYPDYFRIDLTLGYKRDGRKTTQEWRFYLQNATDRNNVFMEDYDAVSGTMKTTNQIGILPVFQYRISF